jgi:hypothetical protein
MRALGHARLAAMAAEDVDGFYLWPSSTLLTLTPF